MSTVWGLGARQVMPQPPNLSYRKHGSICTGFQDSVFCGANHIGYLWSWGYHTTGLTVQQCKCSSSNAAVLTKATVRVDCLTAWLVCTYEWAYCHLLSIFGTQFADRKQPHEQPRPKHYMQLVAQHHWHPNWSELPLRSTCISVAWSPVLLLLLLKLADCYLCLVFDETPPTGPVSGWWVLVFIGCPSRYYCSGNW